MTEKASHIAVKALGKSWELASDLERRVLHAVVERLRITRHVQKEMEESLTFGEWLADRVAALGGSWSFIIIFFVVLAAWMVLNSLVLLQRAFDPYPYILLNLLLSCLASIQAPIILMSQNRQAAKDRQQAAHDYEVNLKAEIEIMRLHERIELLRTQELARMLELLEAQASRLESLERRPP